MDLITRATFNGKLWLTPRPKIDGNAASVKMSAQNEGAGPLIESLQLQALTLTVKALIATHPKPDDLDHAMRNLFAQYQTDQMFLALTEPQRAWMREVFASLLRELPEPNQPSADPT